jgi:NAD(P)H dehydrogenase (quinone)
MTRVVVVYHSGFGHTKRQAEAVHKGAAAVAGTEAVLLTTAEAEAELDSLDHADAILFGCPTYMGSMSAEMKRFLEVAAKKWLAQAWKDKLAGGFTNSSGFSGDKLNTLVGLCVNAAQHGMIWVGTGTLPPDTDNPAGPGPLEQNRLSSFLGAMASSQRGKPDVSPPPGDLATAEAYGRRIAELAKRLRQ